MKTNLLPLLLLMMTFASACEKEDIGPKLRREAEESLIGKWMVDKIVQEEYKRFTTLSSTNEYTGTTNDYYYFRQDKMVDMSTATNGQTVVGFEVINPYQLTIDNLENTWRIHELTATRLTLIKDRNNVVRERRSVTTIYLKR